MTGVTVPTAALGGGIALGSQLPYTGVMLTIWVAIAVALVVLGVAFRLWGRWE